MVATLIPFLLIIFCLFSDTKGENVETRRNQSLGGFNPVNCKDIGVRKAVKYAVELFFALNTQSPAATEKPISKSVKKGKKSHKKSAKNSSGITFKVYKAEEQVVDGINYKIAAFAYVNGICHGVREDVIIFQDLSGEYSVVDWGVRYDCDQVNATKCNA